MMFDYLETETYVECQYNYKVLKEQKSITDAMDLLLKNYNTRLVKRVSLKPKYDQTLKNSNSNWHYENKLPWSQNKVI